MSCISPLHISHSAGFGDGGISFAISDLLAAQQDLRIYSRWLTADRFLPLVRAKSLLKAAISAEGSVCHLHGLWRTQTRIALHLKKQKIPYIISPHGMLDSWALAHSAWKKRLAWHLWEYSALQEASCLQALCNTELIAIQQRVRDVPIALIPNGVYMPSKVVSAYEELPWQEFIPIEAKVLLFFGRFHQKKGLEPLMNAWQSISLQAKNSGWWLVFIGFGDDGRFQTQLRECPVRNCLAFDAVFGSQKHAVLQHASAFILPSFSEGLPMAALEAMAYGLPILISNACNIPEAFSHKAALHAEPEVDSLCQVLLQLFSLSDSNLSILGNNARQLAEKRFSWQQVAAQTLELYDWIDGNSQVPKFVVNDY